MIDSIRIFCFLLPFCAFLIGCDSHVVSADERTNLSIELKNGEKLFFSVEIAETSEEMAQGLMNRKHLDADSGMLFLFPEQGFQSFWMKNTLIPLDVIFINQEGIIGHIHHYAMPKDLTSIPSQIPAHYALEINGGLSASKGIQVGQKVFHERIVRK